MFGKLLVVLGSILLVHAGYYTVQYESYVKLAEVTDAAIPPFAAKVELAVSFALFLAGVLAMAGDFVPIRSTEFYNNKSFDWVVSNPEFVTFNHRGKRLPKKTA
ncbi:hypothetical protein SPRG_13148 [Saprolegnia parasitica CBS 223.65]|uniref:Uncharacterized protein n=1 Tax=Saprolegnia parasitica (strain CBS 223.65) TaxID=695850 RepID=A0A067C4L5_SAPPC|nr:hypothetical protein SPRG_13148 [Saprolegnia parasitica CBS 223.65]KDO21732.1 hypothetical protein SPRG_13148 [Saprolegnia parasitica CBS 223.65]|eukprot:XP_012207535.1 hypothetical protein SPRG_13148 [Saprolegnia parasitica CBS 223.65]